MKLIKEDMILTEAPSIKDIAKKVGGAIKTGAVKAKDYIKNYPGKVKEKNIAERGYKQSELDSLSTDEILNKIQPKEGYTGNNAILIDEYISRLEEETGDTAGISEEAKSVVGESISTLGVNDNPMLTFIKNYMKSGAPQLDGDMASMVYSLWANDKISDSVIENQNSYLYDEKVYNGDENENMYKLKSMVFVDDPRNTQKFGLYRKGVDGNRTDDLIDTSDIINLSARDIEKFLNNIQTRNKGDDINSIGAYLAKNNLTAQTAYSTLYSLLKQKYSGSALMARAQSLKQILSTPQLANDFKQYQLKDTSDNSIINALNSYIVNYRKSHVGSLGTSKNKEVAMGDYLAKNNLTVQTAYPALYNLLKQKYNGSALSARAQSLKQILSTPQLANDFRQYRLHDTSDNSVVDALNSYLMNYRKSNVGSLGTSKSIVMGDYLAKNNLTPQTSYSHFYNLLKSKYKGSALSNRASSLKQILSSPTYFNDFRKYEVAGGDVNNYYGRGRSGSRGNQLNRLAQEAVDSLVPQFGEANRGRLTSLAKKYYKKGIALDELQTQMVQNFYETSTGRTNTRGHNS